MPVQFNIKGKPSTGDWTALHDTVREKFGISPKATVKVAPFETLIQHGQVLVRIPVSVASLKNNKGLTQHIDDFKALTQTDQAAEKFAGAVMQEVSLLSEPQLVTTPANPKPPAQPVVQKSYDDMTDDEWVTAMADKLFPGVIHLYQATELHQPVLGTSSSSIYKTCFIGPELKVAARLKSAQVSFRVTTNKNLAPQGEVKKVFETLGVVNEYTDRLTCHASMTGGYGGNEAEYRALFGAFYGALRPWISSAFPALGKLEKGVK